MIHTHISTIIIGYVVCFLTVVMSLWLYPKFMARRAPFKQHGHLIQRATRMIRCAQCRHVCFDLGDGAEVQCAQCGHWNPDHKVGVSWKGENYGYVDRSRT